MILAEHNRRGSDDERFHDKPADPRLDGRHSRSYVRLPKDQVDEVCKLLETNGIRFWVAHLSISVNGMPFVSTINLRLGTNPEEVQTLLDAVA